MILMTAGSCFKKIHEFLKPFKYKFWFESVCAQMTEVSGPGQKRVCDLWGLTTGSYTGLTQLAYPTPDMVRSQSIAISEGSSTQGPRTPWPAMFLHSLYYQPKHFC